VPINQKRNVSTAHRCFGFDPDLVDSVEAKFSTKYKKFGIFMFLCAGCSLLKGWKLPLKVFVEGLKISVSQFY
jgi:hypothetical protein